MSEARTTGRAERPLVRPLAARDKDAWRALFDAYIAFYRAEVADAVIEATWERMLALSHGMTGLVAVDGGDRPIGLAHLVFHVSTWSPTTYCYLEDLYVAPEHQGRGAGHALVEATYREAEARAAKRVYWVTEEDNQAARRLYDTLGRRMHYVQYRRE
ncbi:MAG TPA: GNAT family N-acetyltransferase [Hyphomicrobiaceae bacterium]|nr:GNAT family N-acetyltransferase [Hyphomicrobiaceae bacterium]